MAERLQEDFLTCIICHEVYTDPVTLDCGHCFCAQCITSYTKTQQAAITKASLPCPHCRQLTKAPDPRKPPEEWASQIKTGLLVKGMVDAFQKGKSASSSCTDTERETSTSANKSSAGSDIPVCFLCQEDGDIEPASVWCRHCEKALCKNCQKVHRKLNRLHEVDDIKDRSPYKNKPTMVVCPTHTNMYVDMLCRDCKTAICTGCAFEKHRKCQDVLSKEDANIYLDSCLKKQKLKIDENVEAIQQIISLKQYEYMSIEVEASQTTSRIQRTADSIVDYVRRKQKIQVAQVDTFKEKALSNVRSEVDAANMALAELQEVPNDDQSAPLVDRLERLNRLSALDTSARSNLSTKRQLYTHSISLQVGTVDKELEKLIMEFGVAEYRKTNVANVGWKIVLRRVEGIYTMLALDKSNSNIDSLIVMNFEGFRCVLVTDSVNMCLKVFISFKKTQSILRFDAPPRGLTETVYGCGAVTIPTKKQVVFYRIREDQLVRQSSIKTQLGYSNLASLNTQTMFASSTDPAQIDVIDMMGFVLRTISGPDHALPLSICATKTTPGLLITDNSRTIKWINDHGRVLFKRVFYCRSIKSVTQNSAGDIFMLCWRGEGIFIMQLDKGGSIVRVIHPDGEALVSPECVHIDDNNFLYVSSKGAQIHVYKFE